MKYFLRQKSQEIWNEGFYIKQDNGEQKYFVKTENGKLSAINIFDLNENVLLKIQKKLFRYDVFDSKMQILFSIGPNFSFKNKKYLIKSEYEQFKNIKIDGNYLSLNYDIFKPEEILAQISKRIIYVLDTYCCDIIDEQNELYYIAMSIIIDLFTNKNKS